MSLHFIGQRFRVSRGGCWQCVPDCRSLLAEALTFSQMAYNYSINPPTAQQTTANDSRMTHCDPTEGKREEIHQA